MARSIRTAAALAVVASLAPALSAMPTTAAAKAGAEVAGACTFKSVAIYGRRQQSCLNAQSTLQNYYFYLGRGGKNRHRWGDWECRGTKSRGTCKVIWGVGEPVDWNDSKMYFRWRPR